MSGSDRRFGELLTGIAVLAVFTPVLWAIGGESDYTVHAGEAQYWAEHGTTRIPLPTFLFAGLTALVHSVIPRIDHLTSAVSVSLAAQVLLGVLLYRALPPLRGSSDSPVAGALLALSLMLVMPVSFFTLSEQNLYFGYLAPSPHHNPTLTLLKPLAWLAFVAAARSLADPAPDPSRRGLAGTALVVALGTLAKPNFTMVLLPSLAAGLVVVRGVEAALSSRAFWFGFALPGAAVLLGQFAMTYSSAQVAHPSQVASGIAFAPLAVMRALSPDGLMLKFVCSILFPAAVVVSYPAEARRDRPLGLAWLCFGTGAFLAYGFTETGPRALDGNFLWSAQISLFILFAASLRFALERSHTPLASRGSSDRREWIIGGTYALHVAAGLLWLAVQGLHRIEPDFPILRDWF